MVINTNLPPQREYKSLIYMGRVPPRMQLKDKPSPWHMRVSQNIKHLGPSYSVLSQIAGSKFVMVEPCIQNVNATIKSFDNAEYGEFRTESLDYAKAFFVNEYNPVFQDCVADSEEVANYIDWTKSAGYDATVCNIRSKGELIKDPEYLLSPEFLNPTVTQPMVSIANKKELKLKTDVMSNKIRLFFLIQLSLIQAQIKYGKRSSIKLMNYKWSAYGFSPFRGGAHKLGMDLNSKIVRFFYDLSGWDKFVPLMRDLYELITQMSDIPDHEKPYFEWMIRNTIAFLCVLWDGDVVLKNYGNCSGSGTTTRDNILMHVILAACFLAEAYYKKMGVLPTFQLLAEQIVKLFGDDSVFAVDIEFEHVLYKKDEEDGFLRTFFKRFGMKLKFLYGGIDYPVDKMEFLGFRFHLINGRYYPYYDPARLATSFIYTNDKCDDLDAYVSKCFVLTMMSYATEYREVFLTAYKKLINYCSSLPKISPKLAGFTVIGPLTAQILESFYSGLEASLTDFSFFYEVLEEVGIKESIRWLDTETRRV